MQEYNQLEKNFDVLLEVWNEVYGEWNSSKLELEPNLKEKAMKTFYNFEWMISNARIHNYRRERLRNEVRNKAHNLFGIEYFKNYNNADDIKSRVEFLESIAKVYSFLHGAELGGLGMLIKIISDDKLKEAKEGPWKEYFEKQHDNQLKDEILQELLKYVKNGEKK